MFRRDIARARTFGFLADVEQLWARGLALGASLDNAVVIGDDRVLNPEGLRYADECVRHKALDAVGDLALAGAPILGLYRSYRGGPPAQRHGHRGADRGAKRVGLRRRRPAIWRGAAAKPLTAGWRAAGGRGLRARRLLSVRPVGCCRFCHKFARLACHGDMAKRADFG